MDTHCACRQCLQLLISSHPHWKPKFLEFSGLLPNSLNKEYSLPLWLLIELFCPTDEYHNLKFCANSTVMEDTCAPESTRAKQSVSSTLILVSFALPINQTIGSWLWYCNLPPLLHLLFTGLMGPGPRACSLSWICLFVPWEDFYLDSCPFTSLMG